MKIENEWRIYSPHKNCSLYKNTNTKIGGHNPILPDLVIHQLQNAEKKPTAQASGRYSLPELFLLIADIVTCVIKINPNERCSVLRVKL